MNNNLLHNHSTFGAKPKFRLARLYLEIDGKERKTSTTVRCAKLPRMGVAYPTQSGAYDGLNPFIYRNNEGAEYFCETDNPITRYWKWENEQ